MIRTAFPAAAGAERRFHRKSASRRAAPAPSANSSTGGRPVERRATAEGTAVSMPPRGSGSAAAPNTRGTPGDAEERVPLDAESVCRVVEVGRRRPLAPWPARSTAGEDGPGARAAGSCAVSKVGLEAEPLLSLVATGPLPARVRGRRGTAVDGGTTAGGGGTTGADGATPTCGTGGAVESSGAPGSGGSSVGAGGSVGPGSTLGSRSRGST